MRANQSRNITICSARRCISHTGYAAKRRPTAGLVRELCEEEAARFLALGQRRLKGFADKIPVFRFEWRN